MDIVCSKSINNIFSDIEINFNLYWQVKFHKNKISTYYIKQILKDKLYKTIIEKNTLTDYGITIFISHKGFTEKAKKYAKIHNILLLDTKDILNIAFR